MISVCSKTGLPCFEKSELPLLFEISKMMNESDNLTETLNVVMELIARHIGAKRTMLTIFDKQKEETVMEVGFGLNKDLEKRIRYKVGEGIIGEVVRTGKPIYVPSINDDNRFMNKTGIDLMTRERKNISFTCAPIMVQDQVAGTIAIDRIQDKSHNYKNDIRLLTIIGTLIATAVKARQKSMAALEELKEKNTQLENRLSEKSKRPSNVIGNSSQMRDVYNLIGMVASTNANVLIRGESGVGKELIADAIHSNSNRANGPFIKVNCSALPESLIESELLGHEKGAFTGAVAQKKGRFELADGGTIFLDEIGDVPISTQVKLLRILQEREFERVGGMETVKVDVRIIAATNRNLEEMIKDEKFREDFFYRINVFPIYVPPLRERFTDIPLLVDTFIDKCNRVNNTNVKRISSSALDMLTIYKWPGNVRELENCIERACIMCPDGVIRSHNLPPTLQTAESSGTELKGTFNYLIGNLEKQLIIDTLTKTKGNVKRAADVLDITERMIGTRIKKYGIEPKRYKKGDAED